MSVNDQWHKSRPKPGEPKCATHKMVPTAGHGEGHRWQVRWRDEDGRQRARSFAKKTGTDPDRCADAFDAKVRTQLDDGSYIDPSSANVTFKAFAEDWRKNRTHDVMTAGRIERELRLHVYPAIGHRTMLELGKRPSLTAAWISGMKLAPSSARQVIADVSSVFIAAMDDGLLGRNPVQAKSVTRPKVTKRKAQPWTLDQIDAMAAALPERYAVVPYLGAGTGMRQGEVFALALPDVDFLRKVVHVQRQVRLVRGVLCFAPVKNRKAHDVPLAESLAPVLAEHIRLYPPAEVTLPWLVPGGELVTCRLILTRPGGAAVHRDGFSKGPWHAARVKAKIPAGRDQGMHVLRHTFASACLAAGVDIVSVAAWLGDTVKTVWETYAHLMPDADDRGRKAMDVFFTRSAPALHGDLETGV